MRINNEKNESSEFYYYEFLSPEDKECVDLLCELCPDFSNYHFLKCDLYKGSLFGGANVYFKRGQDNNNGLVSTKRNIKLYKLDDYPYNFKTEAVGKGRLEYGWTGEVLLTMLKSLVKYK